MPAPSVSILVVSYNTREMTLASLQSVLEQTKRASFELIVVDNCSADGSADALDEEFGERFTLIRSEQNLGFARANNLAAAGANGEYLLLLNPDTLVLDGAIDQLVEFARQRPGAGIWGGRTVFADGSLNPASCWGRPTLWSLVSQGLGFSSIFRGSALLNPEGYGGWRRDQVREVDIVSGCFLLIRRELWDRLGGFDPQFFMYGEEADLCLRARRLGARPIVTPDATIVHFGGASEKVRGEKMVRLLRAKVQLLRCHWRSSMVPFGVSLLGLWALGRAAVWGVASLGFRGDAMERAGTWWTVWSRRREWATP